MPSQPQDLQALAVELRQGVARIRFVHPPHNTLDVVLVPELLRVIEWLEADDRVRVAVFASGLPDRFLGHADLRLLQQLRDAGTYDQPGLPLYTQLLERLRALPKACIAVVAGRADGGGAEFALSMDMCFADQDRAVFSLMEITLAILPGGGGAQYLARKAGRSRAMEACLGGADYPATEAERFGWINRALPTGELDGFVDALAARIASHSARSIALNKAAVNLSEDGRTAELERSAALFAELVRQPEFDARVERHLAGAQPRRGSGPT